VIIPKASIKENSIMNISLHLVSDLQSSNYLIDMPKLSVKMQKYAYYKLDSNTNITIQTVQSLMNYNNFALTVGYVAIYGGMLTGIGVNYFCLTATDFLRGYRFINIDHPPNLQNMFQTQFFSDIAKVINQHNSKVDTQSNSPANKIRRGLSDFNDSSMKDSDSDAVEYVPIPNRILMYYENGVIFPKYALYLGKLLFSSLMGFVFYALRAKNPELFTYETCSGKLLSLAESIFGYNLFFSTVIAEFILVNISCMCALRYSNSEDFDGRLNIAWACIVVFFQVRSIIQIIASAKQCREYELTIMNKRTKKRYSAREKSMFVLPYTEEEDKIR